MLDAAVDGCTGVVVADGVGSWARSGLAAAAATDAAAAALREHGPERLDVAFAAAWPAVQELDLDTDAPEDQAGTTLLLAALDHEGLLHVGYVGNGAIFTVAPIPGAEESLYRLLWNNLLLPHSGFEHGREVLTRSYNTVVDAEPVPSLLQVDLRRDAVVVITSDGIWSDEQSPLARTGDGRVWAERPPILTTTLDVAAELATGSVRDEGKGAVEAHLARHLDGLAEQRLLGDDATVGLILT